MDITSNMPGNTAKNKLYEKLFCNNKYSPPLQWKLCCKTHRARIRDHLLERQQRRWDLNNKQTLTTSAAHSCNIAHWPQWMRFNLSIPKASLPRVSYEQRGTLKQETSPRLQDAEPLQLLKQQYWRKGKKNHNRTCIPESKSWKSHG